jgi:hypothetical protein
MTKAVLMVGDDMPAAARAEILAALADSDCEVVFTEDAHIGKEIHVGNPDVDELLRMPIVEIERVRADDIAPPDAGYGRRHRAQRAAGEAQAEVLVMTRQQRRAMERAAQKGR